MSGCRQAVGAAQGVDAGGRSLGAGAGVEPGTEALDAEGDAGEDVLQVELGQAAVAGVAQVGAADRLGDGALHAGTPVVAGAPSGGGLGLLGRQAGLMDRFGVDADPAGPAGVGLGALGAQGAGAAVGG